MRSRYLVSIVAGTLAIALIAVVALRSQPSSVAAQATSTHPLLYNEIAEWCPHPSIKPLIGACNDAQFDTLADGSVRVLLDINPGSEDAPATPGKCVTGIAFPDDVTGSAYVLEGDRYGVLDLAAVKATSQVCEFVVRRAG